MEDIDGIDGPEYLQLRKVPLPESSFRTKLIEEVQRKLQKALDTTDNTSQRQELLRQLFTDVALEVDNRALGLLYGETQRLAPPASSGGGKSSLCFYEILAEHYAQRPEDGDALVPLFQPLWTLPFTSRVFTLLMHQWLFMAPVAHAEEIQRFSRAFIIGLGDVLWIDIQSNVRRFLSLYMFVVYEVVLRPSRLAKVPPQAQKDLTQLICRFFFFYEPPQRLSYFLSHLPSSISSPFIGGPADFFVMEFTNQLQKVKVEPVLLRYLECSQALKGIELRTTTSIRLQVALYSMASPGGPLVPTRAVRHTAKAALDHLFPVGKRFRTLISLVFRLLHPAYWPGSFLNFVKFSMQSLYYWTASLWRPRLRQRWPMRQI